MGFQEAIDGADSSTDSSTTSGSSTSSSSSGRRATRGFRIPNDPEFPVYTRAVPYAVIREKDGDYEFKTAGIVEVEMVKKYRSDSWSYADAMPGEWDRVFWSQDEFRRIAHIVKSETGEDLRELLNENPRNAVRIMRESGKTYEVESRSSPPMTRECQVCGDRIHMKYGDYEEIKNDVVCSDHTVEELLKAGVHMD